MEERKTKQIHLRVSEEEEKMLREKAEVWGGSVSAFILNACRNHSSEDRLNKLQAIRGWNEEFRKFKADMDKIGTNINQIAHVINVMKLQGEVTFSEDMVEEIARFNKLAKRMWITEERFSRGLLK